MPPEVWVDIGPAESISDTSCIAVAGGLAIAIRVGDRVCAYRNRCLHQDSPLAGAWVRDGVLSCPNHFWRYHADDGSLVDTTSSLESFPVRIIDGHASVLVPDEPPRVQLRDQLLARARAYDRDVAWRNEGNR